MSSYVLPELPYDYGALQPHLSARIVQLHHSKHHATYVQGIKTTLERMEEARAADQWVTIIGLESTLAFNLSGHVLHSILWTNLSPEGGGTPDGALADAIAEQFGSFNAFRSQMSRAAATVQGSGWAILAYEPLGHRLLIEQAYDHQGNVGQGTIPLLVIDAWEHAYYLQYENRRADYITAIWNIISWQNVAERFALASSALAVPTGMPR
ncbi:MAG: superoxide dismutase [Acidimicrobiales bacterium]